MFPTPLIDYLPRGFRENPKDSTTEMCDEADDQLDSLTDDIIGLKYLSDIERCPAGFLSYLGYLVNAGIINTDDDFTKRSKIHTAIATHKTRGSWSRQAKLVIDAITGYSAVITAEKDADDWIETGDGVLSVGSDWAIEGGDGTAPYGFLEVGSGIESEIPGNIYIDCHSGVTGAVLTAAQITQIRASIEWDVVPAYMIVYLCYHTALGELEIYPSGTI